MHFDMAAIVDDHQESRPKFARQFFSFGFNYGICVVLNYVFFIKLCNFFSIYLIKTRFYVFYSWNQRFLHLCLKEL